MTKLAVPPSQPGRPGPALSTAGFGPLALVTLIVWTLYIGREVFVPVALAVLLSFVLAPAIRLLRRVRVPRAVAVVGVVIVAFAAIGLLALLMMSQVNQLAADLPRYQLTIRDKITSLRGSAAGTSALERAAGMLQDLGKELDRPRPDPDQPSLKEPADPMGRPIPVEVREPDPGALHTLAAFITPLIQPLTTTGIVVIFVIFILLQREDLRNRFIRLAGTHDLQKTTAALDDAAARLSRLFLTQLALNAGFGLVIGLGLWAIGVPSPLLWGILTAILRFIPYIGAIISAAFPLALTIAVDPGWSMLLWTAALFLIAEPVAAHVVEPLVYGRSTGLSPVAVVAAATFWTWLWGPIGLVLATPLTVCLVVLGRHVERLEFLDVLLGDRPALSPPEIFYQRILAGDPSEAADTAEEVLKERSLSSYYDEVALEGLHLARVDVLRGALDAERLNVILESVREVVDDLSDHEDRKPQGTATRDAEAAATIDATDEEEGAADLPTLTREELGPAFQSETPILCIAGQGPLDEAAALMLAQLLTKHGLGVRIEAAGALSTQNLAQLDTEGAALGCLCYLDDTSPAHMRYAVRRLRRRLPGARIVLSCLRSDAAEPIDLQDMIRVDLIATTLRETVRLCLEEARAATGQPLSARQ
ncbi:AI-2E family transporter [Bosea sp. BK604]|uniref:AI-2E family transporter n=1 Tax=Bosea sp. BK604 TaxID=2512180 RepID=UPI0010477174|nr:AI-2E family transporter [Bosea sp. BK604]TCR63173.1 putative PurR-regulated permease PerM [Bosea sp. BK604]